MTTTDQDYTKIPLHLDPEQARFKGIAYHGNVPFDVPFISHITHNLYVGGCKDGLILPHYINHVVSLYPWEQYSGVEDIDSFTAVRMYDDSNNMPNVEKLEGIASWAASRLLDGPTLIHCQVGLNRSNLIATLAMSMAYGMEPYESINLLREKRSPAVLCNTGFVDFLMNWKAPV